VRIDEKGIDAQAVTGIGGVVGGVGAVSEPPTFLLFNRPFLFTLADHDTHAVLFAGAVLDPRK
jgi:serine protease inhibitor